MTTSRRRVAVGGAALISTGATSLTGLLVNVAAARSLSQDAFGKFSVVYLALLVVVTLLRAVYGEVILFAPTHAVTAAARSSTAAVAKTAAGLAVVGMLGSVLDEVAFVAAATLVPICAQDNYRFLAFARRRAGVAAISDLVTLTGPLSIVLFLPRSEGAGAAALIAWGASALVGALIAEGMLRPGHAARSRELFTEELKPVRRAALNEFLSTTLAYQIPLLAVPVVASFSDVGTLRSLQMAFAPVTIMHAALLAVLVPRLTTRYEERGALSWSLIVVYVVALSSLTIAITVTMSAIPGPWIGKLLGDSGRQAQPYAWIYASVQAAAILSSALTVAHRIRNTYSNITIIRFASAASAPALCLAGVASFGVAGACVGLVAAHVPYLVFAGRSRRAGRALGAQHA